MGREFKAVFFDLDGTLVDIHGPLYVASRNALRDIGHDPDLTRERFHEALARDDPYIGVPDDQRPDYFKLAFAYLVTELDRTERLEVLPHVHATLAELKQRGYATAVITSRPGDVQRLVEKLAMVGLAAHIDRVLTQSSATLKALDKTESLKHAAAQAAILPQACMYSATSRAISWRPPTPATARRSPSRPAWLVLNFCANIRNTAPTM